jgi:hypothetical protein
MHAKPMRLNRSDAIMATVMPAGLGNARLPQFVQPVKAALEINEILA